MKGVKKWGIKVRGKWWTLDGNKKPATYLKKADAAKDAADFNSMRLDKEKIYTVEEYKK